MWFGRARTGKDIWVDVYAGLRSFLKVSRGHQEAGGACRREGFRCFLWKSPRISEEKVNKANLHPHTGVMTSHTGTNTLKFAPSRWGWPPFGPIQTRCANSGGFGACNVSFTELPPPFSLKSPFSLKGASSHPLPKNRLKLESKHSHFMKTGWRPLAIVDCNVTYCWKEACGWLCSMAHRCLFDSIISPTVQPGDPCTISTGKITNLRFLSRINLGNSAFRGHITYLNLSWNYSECGYYFWKLSNHFQNTICTYISCNCLTLVRRLKNLKGGKRPPPPRFQTY